MLYEDILRGCEEYHRGVNGPKYDKAYSDYLFVDKNRDKWDDPDTLDLGDAGKVVAFLNQWKTTFPARLIDLLSVLKEIVPCLKLMKDKTVLDANLNSKHLSVGQYKMSIDQAKVMMCFEKLAECGDGYLSTATSKILHTINPELFVMWDRPFRKNHRNISEKGVGREYALTLLPEMQHIANKAVEQVAEHGGLSRGDAIKSFTDHCKCSNSLAKIIDEYNFVISR